MWLRERTAMTPGRLRFFAALLAVALLFVGIVAVTAARDRRQATHAVATETEPVLVEADTLYSSLSDADATATTTFLTGGLEPPARRRRYLRDLHTASAELTALAREVGDSTDAGASVSTIASSLPLYSGEIETARANNRQGLPIGAAYLRSASGRMRGTILPAAGRLYDIEARRLASDYESGVSSWSFAVLVFAGLAALALLVLAQLYVMRLSNRIFNLPLLGASLLLVGLVAWAATSFALEQNALSRAQRDGSDSVEVLSATRILLLRAESDESLALVARGGGDAYAADFAAVTRALGAPDGAHGLLADAGALATRTHTDTAFGDFAGTLRRFEAVHGRIGALEASGEFPAAVSVAVGRHAEEAPLAARLNTELAGQITAAQARFEKASSDATSALRDLLPGILLLVVGSVVLVLVGFGLRLKEYR